MSDLTQLLRLIIKKSAENSDRNLEDENSIQRPPKNV